MKQKDNKYDEAHQLLMDWANALEKPVPGLSYSSKNHICNAGIPSNPIFKQMGDLKDLPILVSRPDISRADSLIREMSTNRQLMIQVRYIGLKRDESNKEERAMLEQDHRKELGMGKTKYWTEWNEIYKEINVLT